MPRPVPPAKTPDDLTDPPFYLPQFEEAYQYIIHEYEIAPRETAIFIPCAVRKPYSSSPSHKLFHKLFAEVFPDKDRYHVVIFGTCGTVPAELELMYPFAHYHYMLGNVKDQKIKDDFLEIETRRLTGYLEKTKDTYEKRIAYCIGIFRAAMEAAVETSGIPVEIYPTRPMIAKLYDDDCPFPEGSLSMQEYLNEFKAALEQVRDS
jgi:archaeosine synthase